MCIFFRIYDNFSAKYAFLKGKWYLHSRCLKRQKGIRQPAGGLYVERKRKYENSHHGGKTFSPRWENFFIGVKKLFHHGEKTFKRDYLFLAADFAFRFLLLKMSAKELKSCCTMMPMPCVVSVFFVKYLSFIWL